MSNKHIFPVKEVRLSIVMKSGKMMTGKVNIIEADRFSDFIEEDSRKYIRLYDVQVFDDDTMKGASEFVLVPKDNIDWYHPIS